MAQLQSFIIFSFFPPLPGYFSNTPRARCSFWQGTGAQSLHSNAEQLLAAPLNFKTPSASLKRFNGNLYLILPDTALEMSPSSAKAAGSRRLRGRGCQAALGRGGAQARALASFCLSIGTPLHLKQRWCVTQLSRTLKATCFHSSAQPSSRRSWRVHSNTVLFRAATFFTLCSGQELFKMWAIVAPYWPCTAAGSQQFQLWNLVHSSWQPPTGDPNNRS